MGASTALSTTPVRHHTIKLNQTSILSFGPNRLNVSLGPSPLCQGNLHAIRSEHYKSFLSEPLFTVSGIAFPPGSKQPITEQAKETCAVNYLSTRDVRFARPSSAPQIILSRLYHIFLSWRRIASSQPLPPRITCYTFNSRQSKHFIFLIVMK